MDGANVAGRIRMSSLFRNRYVIEVGGVNSWILRMPVFTLKFNGESATSKDIWVIAGPSKMEWNILYPSRYLR
jgi:hypothetical protein